jgi:hypothetical protein
MALGRWKDLQAAARRRRTVTDRARRSAHYSGGTIEPRERPFHDREEFTRIRFELAAAPPPPWPLSGDPNIIGEHEVPPVRCGCCDAVIPWSIIKGWRN